MIGNLWICVFQCMTVSLLANDTAMHWRHWFTIVSDVNFKSPHHSTKLWMFCVLYPSLTQNLHPKMTPKVQDQKFIVEMPRAQYISRIAPAADDLARQSLTTSDQLLAQASLHHWWLAIHCVRHDFSSLFLHVFANGCKWNVHSTNPPRFTCGSGQSFTWHLTIPISS